jgi:hypothetical protein
MKILILGHGGHGKDEVANILANIHGLWVLSSSECAFELIRYELQLSLAAEGFFVDSHTALWNTKFSHRELWRKLIKNYNTPNLDRLTKQILFEFECDIYIGMRDADEYEASKHHFDRILYVDAWPRVERNDPSMKIEFNPKEMFRIDNSGSLNELENYLTNEFKL